MILLRLICLPIVFLVLIFFALFELIVWALDHTYDFEAARDFTSDRLRGFMLWFHWKGGK